MSTPLPFGSNAITTFAYESFSFTISNPGPYTLTTSNTPGIPAGYLVNNGSNVVFSASGNAMNIGTENFTIVARDISDVLIGTSSNTVSIRAGRFVDPSGNGYAGRNFTFFKNEPIQPIRLVAPFTIAAPTTVPTLPPGLVYTFVASNIYDITGAPFVTVPQSNYLIIGKGEGSNVGKIITSQIGLASSNERVLLNLSGSPIVSPMIVDSAISARVVTAAFPPYPSGGLLRYTVSGFPDGIVISDLSGTVYPSTFIPTDPSFSLVVSGAPTLATANTFRDAGITSTTATIRGTRITPLPQISNSLDIAFAFGETVLFDTTIVPTLYSGVTLDPSGIFYRAQTYFGSASPISNIFSPNLRSDLSLNFVPSQSRASLVGTPGTPGSASFTIRAINSNGVLRDLTSTITVENDIVSFLSPTPAIDTCFSFIISRPTSSALSGYYPSNIRFRASAASGNAVVFSSSGLAGTGLVLSNVSADTVELSGIPDTLTPLQTASITASAVGTPATATRDIQIAVLNDVITLSDISASLLSFVQNRTITPIQLSATTLSERGITSFSSGNLPNGIAISSTGLLTGTPISEAASGSTFSVTASTGFASQSKVYVYQTVKDNIVIVTPTPTITVLPEFSGAKFDILTYSGEEGTLSNSFGDGVVPQQSTTATLGRTLPDLLSGNFSIVPVLSREYRFFVTGQAGTLSTQALVRATVVNPPTIQHTALRGTVTPPSNFIDPIPPVVPTVSGGIYISTDTPISFINEFGTQQQATGPSTWSSTYTFTVEGNGYDLARNSNVFVAMLGSNILRSTDYGNTWTEIASSNIETVSNAFGPLYQGTLDPSGMPPFGLQRLRLSNPVFGAVTSDGNSNWYALGNGTVGANASVWSVVSILRTSTDNGLTWSDVSLSTGTIEAPPLPNTLYTQSNKLSYNNDRLFYTGRPLIGLGTNIFYYADVSDITNWVQPITTMSSQEGGLTGIAFSNTTAFACGTDQSGTLAFESTDNGTTWVAGVNPNTGGSTNAEVFQEYGKWFLGGMSNGFTKIYQSDDLSTWTDLGGGIGEAQAITENGITWLTALADNTFQVQRWDVSNTLAPMSQIESTGMVSGQLFKRLYADTSVTPSNTFLSLRLPYDASGIAFTSPLQTQYTNWQFVPIDPITVTASNPIPGFLYYYASGLPRGLTLNLDISGVESSITGTSSQYDADFRPVVLYAANDAGATGGGGIATFPITMRTILPTVERQQIGAGAYTSLVRQYTIVNAAQNSVNGRALPATETTLGEFTRPEPPDSVSAPGDPNCKKC